MSSTEYSESTAFSTNINPQSKSVYSDNHGNTWVSSQLEHIYRPTVYQVHPGYNNLPAQAMTHIPTSGALLHDQGQLHLNTPRYQKTGQTNTVLPPQKHIVRNTTPPSTLTGGQLQPKVSRNTTLPVPTTAQLNRPADVLLGTSTNETVQGRTKNLFRSVQQEANTVSKAQHEITNLALQPFQELATSMENTSYGREATRLKNVVVNAVEDEIHEKIAPAVEDAWSRTKSFFSGLF